jgi:Flp pilus assembly pilin Flp
MMLFLTRRLVTRIARAEDGQAMIEYALIGSLISVAAIIFLTAVGLDVQEVFDAIENALGLGGSDNDVAGPADPVVEE